MKARATISRGATGSSRSWVVLYRLLLAVLLFGTAVFWGFSSPNGFLKCANLKVVDQFPALDSSLGLRFADPEALIRPIPFAEGAESPWLIEPDRRVELVFQKGLGNCAYLSRGLARRLQLDGISYNVIWLMDREDTRSGFGHTVVECPLSFGSTSGVGIIDMLEGGVPLTADGRLVTRDDLLAHRAIEQLRIHSFNDQKDERSGYYGEWNSRTVLGITTGAELNRYFNLVKLTYIDVGYSRVEKLIYNLGAIVLGVFPTVYVTHEESRRFDTFFQFEIGLARIMIWCVRATLLMLLVDLITTAGGTLHRLRFGKRSTVTTAD